jgi:hypothetical protein
VPAFVFQVSLAVLPERRSAAWHTRPLCLRSDDDSTDLHGNAGTRIACGVITKKSVANPGRMLHGPRGCKGHTQPSSSRG